VMSNYLSVGVDAKAALNWARMAKAVPALFRMRLLNKLWYIIVGTPEFFLHSYKGLSHRCTLSCDGQPVTIPPSIEGLMVLNTPSYGGGSDLWDEARGAPLQATTRHFQSSPARPLDMSDGLVEVVGVTDVLHLACSLGGLSNGVRLCQGERISIGVPGGGVPLQIDGEPYNQAEGPRHAEGFDVTIARSGQALLLSAPAQHSVPGANPVQVVEGHYRRRSISGAQRESLLRALAGSEEAEAHSPLNQVHDEGH